MFVFRGQETHRPVSAETGGGGRGDLVLHEVRETGQDEASRQVGVSQLYLTK